MKYAQGRMDVLMQIDDSHIEGAMGKEFVQRGICPELSLGYHVTMSRSPAGFLKASNKRVVELSLVRQGAREGCKIRMFENQPASSSSSSRIAEQQKAAGNNINSNKHRILV